MANVIEFTIKGIDRFSTITSRFTRSIASAGRSVVKFGSIVAGLGAIVAIPLLNTARAFEKMEVTLGTVTGSAENAAKAMAGIKKFALETPFQVQQLTQSFIKLKSFGIEPTEKVMRAITDQASALGGEYVTLNGITIALGQAWAKQKLQGEEILQLVERGVPVWELLSKEMGVTARELQKMSEKGELGRVAITKLMNAMGERTVGAAAAQMQTLDGKISNLKDTVDNLFDTLGKAGALDVAKRAVTALTEKVAGMATGIIRLAVTVSLVFDKIKKKIQDSIGDGTVFTDMLSIAGAAFNALLATAVPVWAAIARTAVRAFDLLWESFYVLGKAAFERIFDLLFNSTEAVLQSIGAMFVIMWQGVVAGGQFAWNNIKAIFTGGDFTSFSDLLFKDIPAKTAEARGHLTTIMDGVEFDSPNMDAALDNLANKTAETREKIAGDFALLVDNIKSHIEGAAVGVTEFIGITAEEINARVAEITDSVQTVQASLAEGTTAAIEGIVETMKVATTAMKDIAKGVGAAVADTIVESKNLAEGLRNVMKSVLKSIIASLVQLAVQKVLTSKVSQQATISETKAKAGALPGLAAAGGLASMAAAPWPINMTAPAFAGAMYGQGQGYATQALAGLGAGQFHDGGVVPRDGSFTLQGGEVVIPNNPSQDIVNALGDFGGGGRSITIGAIHILENATSGEALLNMSDAEWKDIVEDKIIDALSQLDDEGIRPREQERQFQ